MPAIAASMRVPCHTWRRAVLKRRGAPRRYLAFTPFPVGLMRIPCRRACLSPMGIYGLYHDAAHRVATLFEKWDYVIKTSLPEEGFPIND